MHNDKNKHQVHYHGDGLKNLLIGMGLGAALVWLFTTPEGEKLRKKVLEEEGDVVEKVKEFFGEFGNAAQDAPIQPVAPPHSPVQQQPEPLPSAQFPYYGSFSQPSRDSVPANRQPTTPDPVVHVVTVQETVSPEKADRADISASEASVSNYNWQLQPSTEDSPRFDGIAEMPSFSQESQPVEPSYPTNLSLHPDAFASRPKRFFRRVR